MPLTQIPIPLKTNMISVIIPAYNESDRIAATVVAVQKLKNISQVIVVDDGSSDNTAESADAAGADIVLRQKHSGKGAAIQNALIICTAEIVLLLDADLGDTASDAAKLLPPVISGVADMTIATFPVIPGKGGGMGLVVRLARWGIRILTGQVMNAPLSGQRAARRDLLTEIVGFTSGWGAETAFTVLALRAGYRVLEVPTQMSHRVTGRSTADRLHRFKQLIEVARTLFRLKFYNAPVAAISSEDRNTSEPGK